MDFEKDSYSINSESARLSTLLQALYVKKTGKEKM